MSVMKKYIYLLIGILAFTFSCSERESDNQFSNTLKQHHWRISNFDYIDENWTGFYKNYEIVFTIQDVVSASGTNFVPGKWFVGTEGDRTTLTLDFGRTFPFNTLNYKWYVTEYNDETFILEYKNDYFGGYDYLTFVKW
jgi:hypothetical protein